MESTKQIQKIGHAVDLLAKRTSRAAPQAVAAGITTHSTELATDLTPGGVPVLGPRGGVGATEVAKSGRGVRGLSGAPTHAHCNESFAMFKQQRRQTQIMALKCQ